MMKLELLEDEVGRKLAQAEKTGELKSAPSYGKPLREDDGWAQTPDELRMGFKILKNAGFVPPEIEMFQERARLRSQLDAAGSQEQRRSIQQALSELEQKLALRLEALGARSR